MTSRQTFYLNLMSAKVSLRCADLMSVKSPCCQECKYFISLQVFSPTLLQFFQVPANKDTLLLAAYGVLEEQNEDGKH